MALDGTPNEQREWRIAPNSRHTHFDGRYWPTEKIRPGESVSDYCRRLDVYENAKAGVRPQQREDDAA